VQQGATRTEDGAEWPLTGVSAPLCCVVLCRFVSLCCSSNDTPKSDDGSISRPEPRRQVDLKPILERPHGDLFFRRLLVAKGRHMAEGDRMHQVGRLHAVGGGGDASFATICPGPKLQAEQVD
jgi:hypothetical protein